MKIIVLLVAGLISSQLYAEQVKYIRDELYVPLRSGKTIQHRIVHKGLVSGAALTVLKEEDDYSFVRTRTGIEGWIQTQYLSDEPAAKDLLKTANANLAKLREANEKLSAELKATQTELSNSRQTVKELSSGSEGLSEELERIKSISANAIQLNTDNQRLLLENQQLNNKLDIVNADNQRLSDEIKNDQFMNGALAVLLGVIIALVVPRLVPKKKSEWG